MLFKLEAPLENLCRSPQKRAEPSALDIMYTDKKFGEVWRTSLKFGNQGIYSHAICSFACSFVLFQVYLQIGPSITGYTVHADYSKMVFGGLSSGAECIMV